MPQSPFKVDALQLDPLSGDTLKIERDSTTGTFKFTDRGNPAGATLTSIAGLGSVAGTLVVGKSGMGAKYTTIQSAIDDVPISSSATNPYVVLVLPGVYTENVVLEKDGVHIVGFGYPTITPSTNGVTVTIQSSVTTHPRYVSLRGLRLVNTFANRACVRIIGGSESLVGSRGVVIADCEIVPASGGYTIQGSSFNNLVVTNVEGSLGHSESSFRLNEVASLACFNSTFTQIQLDYTTSGSIPDTATCSYVLRGVTCSALLSTLDGRGSLSLYDSVVSTGMTLSGDQSVHVFTSDVGDVVVDGTTALFVYASLYGELTGTGTHTEKIISGTTEFVASDSETVTFDVSKPDESYTVLFEPSGYNLSISNKTSTGFDIVLPSPQTVTIRWMVVE